MPVDAAFKEHMLDMLTPLGEVTARAMFGGFGLFHEGRMFAPIFDSTLYLKVEDSNRASYEQAGSQPFKPMPYCNVTPFPG